MSRTDLPGWLEIRARELMHAAAACIIDASIELISMLDKGASSSCLKAFRTDVEDRKAKLHRAIKILCRRKTKISSDVVA